MAIKGKKADSQQTPAAENTPPPNKSRKSKSAPVIPDTPDIETAIAETGPSSQAAGKRKSRQKLSNKRLDRGRSKGNAGENGRHKQAKRPNKSEAAIIAERRALVWGLTKAKKSVRQISKYLKTKGFRASLGTIQDDRDWLFENAKKELLVDVSEELLLALGVLDDLQGTMYTKAIRDEDKDASAEVRSIMKERDRLINYSKAQQADLEMKNKLIEFLGFDPEESSDADSDGQ